MKPGLFEIDLRRFRPERPPVLLLGGLDLLRPLNLAGIGAIVASPDFDDPVFASRHCGGRCLLPSFKNREAVLETVLAVGDTLTSALGRRIPLVYGDDDHLDLICDYRDVLAQRFLLLLNDPDIDRAMMEKGRFEGVARARGIAVPRTYIWGHAGPNALADAPGPVVAKPKQKMHWDESVVFLKFCGGSGKARIFDNGRKVMADRHARQLRDLLTFQDYIPGDDRQLMSFHGVADENGKLLASFVGRKLRTIPALTGASTFLEMAHDDAVSAFGREVVARAPLKGVFKIDLKRDARDGSFRVLEVNARYTLWHHLGARNGVNLAKVAYDYLVDGKRPAADIPYRTAYRWIYLRLDYQAYRDLASRGELSFWRWILSLLLSRKVCHLFSWSDPGPFISRCSHRLLTWGRRVFDYSRLRLREWLSTAS